MNNYKNSFLSNIPPVVKNLIAINIILWLASSLTPGLFIRLGVNTDLSEILGMHYWASSRFNPVQLITYMFGGVLENLWGPRRFLFYYLLTGVGAAIVQQIFWTIEFQPVITALNEAISSNSSNSLVNCQDILSHYFRTENFGMLDAPAVIELKRMFLNLPVTVGASGAVFGLLLAFGWLFPEAKLMLLFFPVPIKARIFVLLYGVVELFMGVAQFSGDSVAHFAHLGGMLFGAILILYWKRNNSL